jgi:hypothetical protein
LEHLLVRGVLPLHEFLDQPEEPLTFRLVPGIVHHLGEDDRARRRERPAGPPEVERLRMTVPDRLLARARLVDRVERKGDLDQLLSCLHLELPVRRLSGEVQFDSFTDVLT